MELNFKTLASAYLSVLEGYDFIIPEDVPANERTAFHGAAAAAHKAGKSHFDFGGKKYPVTMKKDAAKAINSDTQKEAKEGEPEASTEVDGNDENDTGAKKVPCPKCEGKGCAHCDNKGYHMSKVESSCGSDGKKSRKESVELDELSELKMNDPKLLKVFNKLKPKATVKIKHSSTLEKGKDFIEYTVKSKNTLRNGVEKITLARKDSPTSAKRFLYNRDGKITFAVGDMAASIDAIKENDSYGKIDEISRSMTPMRNKFGGTVDPKKFDAYKKFVKKNNVDEPTVRMICDNPDAAESKRMMKNPKIAQAVDLYKASMKEAYIDHRSDKIGPSNVGMTHAKAEKAHRDMVSKLASSHKRTDLHSGRNSVGDVIKMHKNAADQHAKAFRAHNAGKHSQARNHANKASKHGTDIFNAHANAFGDAKKHSSAGIDAVRHSHDAEKRSIASKEAQRNQRESKESVSEKKKYLSQKDIKKALASIKPPKKKPTLPKAPWDKKENTLPPPPGGKKTVRSADRRPVNVNVGGKTVTRMEPVTKRTAAAYESVNRENWLDALQNKKLQEAEDAKTKTSTPTGNHKSDDASRDTWEKQLSTRKGEKDFVDMHDVETPEYADVNRVLPKTFAAFTSGVKAGGGKTNDAPGDKTVPKNDGK